MNDKTLLVRIGDPETHPNGVLFTDAFEPGTIVRVSRVGGYSGSIATFTVQPTFWLQPIGDSDEGSCVINPRDAAALGIDMDQVFVGDAPVDTVVAVPITDLGIRQNSGGIEPAETSVIKTLTISDMRKAISEASSWQQAIEIAFAQLESYGYGSAVAAFKERWPDVL